MSQVLALHPHSEWLTFAWSYVQASCPGPKHKNTFHKFLAKSVSPFSSLNLFFFFLGHPGNGEGTIFTSDAQGTFYRKSLEHHVVSNGLSSVCVCVCVCVCVSLSLSLSLSLLSLSFSLSLSLSRCLSLSSLSLSLSVSLCLSLSWPFTSLDLSLSFAKHLQALAAAYLKRWSGLPHPANVTILHTGSSKRAGLRITHLATFWKQMQAVRLDILQQSSDSRCSRLYDRLLLRQERWSRRYAPAVEHACALTVVNANPSITDNSHVNQLPRRKRILNIIASVDAEEQLAKLQQLSVQGRWLEWTDVMSSDLSWRRLLHGLDDRELSFSLRVITNTLPTPDNLRRWGQLTTDTSCPLCGRKATLRHILNGCSVALRQGRYTWRHDNVLRILKRHFLKFWECLQRESTNSTKDAPFIHLVPEGLPQLPVRQRQRRPLLSTDTLRCASDWQFLFDVDGGYNVFPIEIAASAQRPDIVIYSLSLRKVLLIELTVPLEDRVAAAHTIKTTRYASLFSACESNGFGVFHFPVEVGSRGFVARSLLDCLRQLGFPPALRRKVRNECSRVALRSSYIIYLRRAIDLWRDMSSLTWKGLQNFSAVSLAQFLRWSIAFLQLVSPCSLYKTKFFSTVITWGHCNGMIVLWLSSCLFLDWYLACRFSSFFSSLCLNLIADRIDLGLGSLCWKSLLDPPWSVLWPKVLERMEVPLTKGSAEKCCTVWS